MAENKTKPTAASVDDWLDAIDHPKRREDGKALCAAMRRITGAEPRMWGPTMVGFGDYHYRYASGREGDMFRVGFSPRKAQLVVYLTCDLDQFADELARLGKHKRGVGCLYVNKLEDVDLAVLDAMIARAWNEPWMANAG